MKKLLLSGAALLAALGTTFAQTYENGYSATGAYDDFATTDFYAAEGEKGLVWWADGNFTTSRPGDGTYTLKAVNIGGSGQYPVFGLNFNDDNGSADGGNPYTVDLSSNADVTFEIENKSSVTLFMLVELEDTFGVKAKIEPNVSDVTGDKTWGDAVDDGTGNPALNTDGSTKYYRKANTGFVLAPNTTETITIDFSSVPGLVGGLSDPGNANCDENQGGGPSTCPQSSYDIDVTRIKGVVFTVNFGDADINLSGSGTDHTEDFYLSGTTIVNDIGLYTGDIIFKNFKLGTPDVVSAVEGSVASDLSVFPNPTSDVLNVAFTAAASTDVTVADITGNVVYSTSVEAGDAAVEINTSDLASGIYFLNVGSETRKVVVE